MGRLSKITRIYQRLYGRQAVAYIDDFGRVADAASAELAYQQLLHLITEILGLDVAPDIEVRLTRNNPHFPRPRAGHGANGVDGVAGSC